MLPHTQCIYITRQDVSISYENLKSASAKSFSRIQYIHEAFHQCVYEDALSVDHLSHMTFRSKGTCDFFLLCVVRLDVYLSVLLVETFVGTCCTDTVYLLCGFGDVYPGMTSVQMFYHTVNMDKVYLQCVCKNALLGLTL